MTCSDFIRSNYKTQWIYEGPLKAYVRKSTRYVDGKYVKFFDVANVEVELESQGRGIFTSFLENLITSTDFNIYVESIQNPKVVHICRKLGFTIIAKDFEVNAYLIRQFDSQKNFKEK